MVNKTDKRRVISIFQACVTRLLITQTSSQLVVYGLR